MKTALVLASCLLVTGAGAQDLPFAPHKRGWVSTESSLLLYDDHGQLAAEQGLGRFRQSLGSSLYQKRVLLGGVSADGRFAWHWEKRQTVRAGRVDMVLDSTSTLAYLGTSGQLLWSSDCADAPEGMTPVLQSSNGETALLIERATQTWTVSGMEFIGDRLTGISGAQRLEKVSLTANGRYALVLWGQMDQALVYSFLDLKNGTRKDIPAADVPIGLARIEEDGSARAEAKILYQFP